MRVAHVHDRVAIVINLPIFFLTSNATAGAAASMERRGHFFYTLFVFEVIIFSDPLGTCH